jgi:uncharacterized protein YndB with AHSA1/START domain
VTCDSVVVECDLPEPPEKVWRALTESDLLSAWIMPNDMRPEVGSKFRFQPEAQNGAPIDCQVLEVAPNRSLSWRQRERGDPDSAYQAIESVVSIQIEANPAGGTHLRLVHGDVERIPARIDASLRCQLRRAA